VLSAKNRISKVSNYPDHWTWIMSIVLYETEIFNRFY